MSDNSSPLTTPGAQRVDPPMAADERTMLTSWLDRHRATVRITTKLELGSSSRRFSNGDLPTLRWALVHLIEETARHNGHLDILRELADGVAGHEAPTFRVTTPWEPIRARCGARQPRTVWRTSVSSRPRRPPTGSSSPR